MKQTPSRVGYPVTATHLCAIGAIVNSWSHIEMLMQVAICRLYEINQNRGLVLTSNIGFQSLVALLRILATRGAIKDKTTASKLSALLKRIEAGYAIRNAVAHAVWSGTANPNVARRMSIRARGNRLTCTDDQITVDHLCATRDQIECLRLDLAKMFVLLDLSPTKSG
jgi:hypothetical protein